MMRALLLALSLIPYVASAQIPRDSSTSSTTTTVTNTAPGIVSTNATIETLEWIWGLERVPFPSQIDTGQWTDYYFSQGAGGDWPAGDDGNDGLTPGTARQTLDGTGGAFDVCFDSAFTRCNFDNGDTWAVGSGYAQMGAVTSAPAACPSTESAALAQPCFWWRSSPGGRATFDASGETGAGSCSVAMTQTSKPVHLLWEAIDLTCDGNGNNDVWNTQELGIMTIVGSDGVNNDPGVSTSIYTPHDHGIIHAYGQSGASFTGTATAATSIGGSTGGPALAVHSSKLQAACTTADVACKGFAMNQASGASTTTITNPLDVLLTGVHVQVTNNNGGSIPFQLLTSNTYTNDANGQLISVFLDQQSTASFPWAIELVNQHDGADIDFDMVQSTIQAPNGGGGRGFHNFNCPATGGSLNIRAYGNIFDTGLVNVIRATDADCIGKLTFTMRDYVYQGTGVSQAFRNQACFDDFPDEFETNCDSEDPGAWTIDNCDGVAGDCNWADLNAEGTQFGGRGYCLAAKSCKGHLASAGDTTVYNLVFPSRLQIPAFIAGKILTGFQGQTSTYSDAGRAR